jgi:hypothetical protein
MRAGTVLDKHQNHSFAMSECTSKLGVDQFLIFVQSSIVSLHSSVMLYPIHMHIRLPMSKSILTVQDTL